MAQASAYHHGDLRAVCLRAARELLEEDGSAGLSLRAVARRAGVSAAAPYRHYADREALVSAVAAEGCRELAEYLAAAHPSPGTADDLAAVTVAYVRFVLDHPAIFRVMFAEPCEPDDAERAAATAAIREYVHGIAHDTFPGTDPAALSLTVGALVHGLAFLHLDGNLDDSTPEVVAGQVRSAMLALFEASSAWHGQRTAMPPTPPG
jgi:AcrR family transcriptional regulator